jgi:PE family
VSYLSITPETLTSATSDLANIGSNIQTANSAAAAQTTSVLAAGEDEISAAIAALFTNHGQAYQTLSAQAAAFHNQLIQTLSAGTNAYATAEAANAAPMQSAAQQVLNAVNAPAEFLLDRPLIGNGANGIAGTGQAGGAGTAGNAGNGGAVSANNGGAGGGNGGGAGNAGNQGTAGIAGQPG